MFRIRQIASDSSPTDQKVIQQVQLILKDRLPGLSDEEVAELPDRIRDPMGHQMQAMLFVADNLKGRVRGFALMSYVADVGFCLLDYLATTSGRGGAGVGGALYARVRESARSLDALGLFLECLPDDPDACSDPAFATSNVARLRFYERFGARPIVGTEYERPVTPGTKDLPHLVYDDLDQGRPLSADDARLVVRAILERKYGAICSKEYVELVVASIRDDPVRVRAPRYVKVGSPPLKLPRSADDRIALVVNASHSIHHVRERGYVQAPVRVSTILSALEPTGLFWRLEARHFSDSHIRAVHDGDLIDFLRKVCAGVPEGKSVYPYVFPIRNATRPPKDLAYCAGYYCIDTFTPLNGNAWKAARRAADCALMGADVVLSGQRFAYALVRPPGHHAERKSFGGFCYLNNAAVAAHYLSRHGRVAILDVDYHHGNGQQDIFYARPDVLTVSIHGDPTFAYPFFTGFAEEIGEGSGEGCNANFPLEEALDGAQYRQTLERALTLIADFAPRFLVVALGFDTAKKDPTGTWSLGPADFEANGRLIGALGLPTLVVQEGGYRTVTLGTNASRFFKGLGGIES
jgi:acetoin utilization deacetylase AcuC-like enzyme/GNAT superfamily N-acetyltransferase